MTIKGQKMSILLVTSRRRAQRVLLAAREAFRFFARCFAATRAFFVLTCFEVIANASAVYRYIFVNNQDGGKLTRSSTEKMRGVEDQGSAVAEQETGTWLSSWFSWCPTSERLLEIAESQILEKVRSYYESEFVPLGNGQKIWTLKLNKSAKRVPLVLVHGFGGGVGLWAMNVDTLAENRTVYAFDVLGFGRSSRPQLSADPEEAEEQFVDSIEQWREKIGLEKFVLLGHSLGGFLASSYAIKYPSRVLHLILADPWGFPVKPTEDNVGRHIPAWVKLLGAVLSPFNPLAGLRAAGPWGPLLVRQFRPDFQRKFSSMLSDDTIFNYIYHCNAQVPSGETAFKSMTIPYGWARHPMIYRIGNIDRNVPITMIYGSRSWIDSSSGRQTQERRHGCYVDIQVITGAGHHVYVDKPDKFNEMVEKVCQTEDDGGVGITVDSDSSN